MAKKAISSGEHAALLLSVGTRHCYRPDCNRPLVVVRDDQRIVDFEIAHIRDELPPADPSADIGWRYWPADLPQKDRNRYGNLLLLCPPCHKLIDKIRPRDFSVQLLHEWKQTTEAENPVLAKELRDETFDPALLAAEIRGALQQGQSVDLQLPNLATPDGLSFASRSTAFTARIDELSLVAAFLASSEPFSWWVVVGPAGTGKSRLALEACHRASDDWAVGFISDTDQAALLHFVPERPTLLVVDYAASRAQWLADLLTRLVERTNPDWPPIRLLILERDTSTTWFDTAVRRDRHHHSVRILGAQYAEPFLLKGFTRGETRALVQTETQVLGRTLSATDVEDVVDRAYELDPLGRPLFTLVACIEHSEPMASGLSRDQILRRLIQRRHSQDGGVSAVNHRSLALVATSLGGISLSEVLRLRQTGIYAALLADPSTMSTPELDRLLPGMVPDMLGELWVLDESQSTASAGEIGRLSLEAAWSLSPRRYAAFVQRTLRDHPSHPATSKLFDVDRFGDETTWFEMCANAIPYLGRPPSPAAIELIRRIDSCEPGPLRDEALAVSHFGLANLHLGRGDTSAAVDGYTALIETAPPNSEVRWQAYTNRGVVAMNHGETDIAEADWNAVIDAPNASDESRACCLNNRADIYVSRGEHEAAVIDRTKVLSLGETSYNRRYIALVRRASSSWHLGKARNAFEDIESILASEDIVIEQKMAARLQRVEWLVHARDQVEGIDELIGEELVSEEVRVIAASRRNFPDVEQRARELLTMDHAPISDSSERRAASRRPSTNHYFAPVRGPR